MSKLVVSSSPHIRSGVTTTSIMRDVIIALAPACLTSVWVFGLRSLAVMVTCVLAAVLSEYICRKILKRSNTISDLSAVVTGLLLAMNLPVTIPLWMAALGSIIAIVIVKQLFGGIGQNFVNPALIGRIVLMTSYATQMTTWVDPFYYTQVDAMTSPTPLVQMANGDTDLPSYLNMLIGMRGGCLGETCILALIAGGIYLVVKRVISPATPIAFIATVGILSFLAGYDPLYQMMSGGLVLGAVFMATDYATTPITTKGKIIFGIGCGLITAFIRFFGSLPEGVSFSIIIMNILTPYIDNFTSPKPFGTVKEKKGGEA
ncbi:MAG: RnfABCDGE type electron transport complex subunit D [Clostridia bacterium]|nr:RnfABCDGE type electron transport complex subunit D [Clostridia bacterium]MEE1024517.1 RnfABCDGE type electron transport complex subunit D [Acutalibacteraceae bacterium]